MKYKRNEVNSDAGTVHQALYVFTAGFIVVLLLLAWSARQITTLREVLSACDRYTPLSHGLDYMVLGQRYSLLAEELYKREVYAEPVAEDTIYPQDVFAQAHYIDLYRPGHPSVVELYSRSTDTTWFIVYPDDFNRYNTQACGRYLEAK